MITLPTKLIVGVCKAYNVRLFAASEKMELITELKKQKPNLKGLPKTYKDSWSQLSKRMKDLKSLLPQIENAIKHANLFSINTDENDGEINQNSNQPRERGNSSSTQHNAPQRPLSAELPRTRNEYFNPNRTEQASNSNERLGTCHNMFDDPSPPSRGRNYASESRNANVRANQSPSQSDASLRTNSTKSKNGTKSADNKSATHLKDYTIKELSEEKYPEQVVQSLPVSTLKRILRENLVSIDGVIEKSTLIQKVLVLLASFKDEERSQFTQVTSHPTLVDHALSSDFEEDDRLCKICYEKNANCVLLECGHSISCVDCGKELLRLNQQCPICRTDIVRVVRIFK